MRRVGLALSFAFFLFAFSPAALPAGAVGEGLVPDAGTVTDTVDEAVEDTVETVTETAEDTAEPVVERALDTVNKVVPTDEIVDPVDPTPDPGDEPDTGGGVHRVDRPAPEPEPQPQAVSRHEAPVTQAPAAQPAPQPAATALVVEMGVFSSYAEDAPAPTPEPFVAGATESRDGKPVIEQVQEAAHKVSLGLFQLIALVLVVAMLSAEFLYGVRRVSGPVLRA